MKCGMVFSRLSLPLRQCLALWDVELRFFTEYVVVWRPIAGNLCCASNVIDPSLELDCVKLVFLLLLF